MADAVRKVEYFSITVADRPGEAFRVLQTLVSSGVNLLACTARQVGEQAQIDVVPDDIPGFAAAARTAALDFASRRSGFLVQGEDRPGALAQNLQRLARAGINVTGIEAMAAGQGRWAAILWVAADDVARAAQALGASR
ncbi:MAG: ACT domain-containing protein [Betaproteobacteria bacterium]